MHCGPDQVRFSAVSPNRPNRSTEGAPQINVFDTGSKARGLRFTTQRANTPRILVSPERIGSIADEVIPETSEEDMLAVTVGDAAGVVGVVVELDETGEDGAACSFSPSRRALRSAFASSSMSSKLSCLTARMEYQ